MINFSTLQGLKIPEGVVTQIADASGRMLWKLITATDEPAAIFEVAKQTTASYAGETQYADNEFILFDIYPKKGGTVKVTYGGLTKTVKDVSGLEEPNAIQVFFGRFNGESDSMATPASGRLTIEGAYRGYGLGSFGVSANKTSGGYAPCVTNVIDFGNPVYIGARTFYECTNIAPTSLPSGLTSIEAYAFYNCTNLALISLPSDITNIGNHAFYQCTNLTLTSLPSSLTSIGVYAFYNCNRITSIVIPASVVSIGAYGIYFDVSDSFAIDTAFRFLGTTPPDIGDGSGGGDAFGPTTFIISGGITVPKGCAAIYKAATGFNRAKRADFIVEAS